ncbi:hypothetical protein FGRA07_08730 [Fusarium graminearum]|nr:hypothetical protein FGRA07_08730 [Fusarium graminearum]
MGNFPTRHENPGTASTFTAHLNELRQLPAWKSDKSKQLLDRFQRGWTAIQTDRAAALRLVNCVAYHVEQYLKDVTSISTAGLTDGSVYFKAMKYNPDRSAITSDQANSASDSRYNLISLNWKIGLLELECKVKVVCRFHPITAPTNGYFGFPSMDKTLVMLLHKDLLRGEGFYNTMVRLTSATGVDSESNEVGRTKGICLQNLTSVDFLDCCDSEWVDSLMMEALKKDPTAGPGFGKTIAAAVVVLAMNASIDKLLASGPPPTAGFHPSNLSKDPAGPSIASEPSCAWLRVNSRSVAPRSTAMSTLPTAQTPISAFLAIALVTSWKNPVSKSKKNFNQIYAALDFYADFVQTKKVNPADLLIVSLYGAIIKIMPGWLKRPEYVALEEGGMVVVITGTNGHVGAGFTSDERRLNVMLSRHKSALVIFSDIDTVDVSGKGKLAVIEGPSGEMTFSKATTLKAVHSMMVRNGRIATVKLHLV